MASLVKFAEDIGKTVHRVINRWRIVDAFQPFQIHTAYSVAHAVDVVPVREIYLKIQTLFFLWYSFRIQWNLDITKGMGSGNCMGTGYYLL